MLHTWKRIKDVYLLPKYIRDDEKFMIKSSPAGGFNVYGKNDKFLSKFKQLKTAKLYYDSSEYIYPPRRLRGHKEF